ncbi:beta-propeller fold lactonase family protein [Microaerobacter geothermalis]|uniref:YVTN family beta-propeller repeat protein n=1 Tax=Microaerobacter geothermalis TaxID=674972 RepID=UPI001F22459F|nr:beta-propeller fold lactonase family protein [Microaerobacter geothermalis]MCF6092522.1 beta-propeller fold lactonase family protein [Microaerobacter geothermalis]
MKKKFLLTTALTLALTSPLAFTTGPVYADEGHDDEKSGIEYQMFMGSRQIKGEIPSHEMNSKLFVPLRLTAEELGYEVKWDPDTKTVDLLKNNQFYKNIIPDHMMGGRSMVSLDVLSSYAENMNIKVTKGSINLFKKSSVSLSQRGYVVMGPGNAVISFDMKTNDIIAIYNDTEIPAAKKAHGLAVSPDGKKLYVSSMVESEVSVFDLEKESLEASIPVGFKTHHIEVNPNGKYVYVTELKGSKISVIDTKTNQVVKTVTTGKGTYLPYLSQDGSKLFVTNKVDNNVVVIDTITNEIIKTFATGKAPSHIAFDDQTETLYVTNTGDGTISIINENENITVSVGKDPHGIGISDDLIFVANAGDETLTLISKKDLSVIETKIIGKTPGHISISPDGGYVYVQVEGEKKVLILDATTGKVLESIHLISDGHQTSFPKNNN